MSNLLTCCQRHPEKTARIDLFVTSSSCFLVNTVYSWTHSRTELRPSTKHPGCYDQPVEATAWLKNFRAANTQFLSKVINLFTFTHIPTRKQQKAGRGEHLGRRIVAVSLLCPQLKLREDHHWTKKDVSPARQDLSKVIEQVMGGLGSEVPLTLHSTSVSENLSCLKHKLSAPDYVVQLWKSSFLFHKTKQKAGLCVWMECGMTLELILVCL